MCEQKGDGNNVYCDHRRLSSHTLYHAIQGVLQPTVSGNGLQQKCLHKKRKHSSGRGRIAFLGTNPSGRMLPLPMAVLIRCFL